MTLQPHVDFGLKVLGADLMSIPGLYRFVQVCLSEAFISFFIYWFCYYLILLNSEFICSFDECFD